MKKFTLFVLLAVSVLFPACPLKEKPIKGEIDITSAKEIVLIVSPFDKHNILGGTVSFVPRVYAIMEDGSKVNTKAEFLHISYKLGNKLLYESTKKPFGMKYDFTFTKNGEYPLVIIALDSESNRYVFQTNVIVSNVMVKVKAKLNTPVPDGYDMYLAGSATVLLKKGSKQEWSPYGAKFKKIDDFTYETTFLAGLYESISVEFTLGTWARKALDENGNLIHKTFKVTKPNQVVEFVLDNWGKLVGQMTATGYTVGFTGKGEELTIAYTQKKDQVSELIYSYDGIQWNTIQSASNKHVHFKLAPQWGKELKFYFSGDKKTNSIMLPAKGLPFEFGIVGDIRASYSSKIPKLIAKEKDLAFIIDTGDIVNAGLKLSDWNAYFSVHKPIISTFIYQPAIGNHEQESPAYEWVTGKPFNYSFVWENCYFISFDDNGGFFKGSQRYKWLENQLKKAQKYKFRLVYMHTPPYSSRKHGDNEMVQQDLVPLFEKYKVNIVICGDDHGYEVSYPMKGGKKADSGVIYLISAGGGASLYDAEVPSEWSRFERKVFHYLKAKVFSERIEFTAIDEHGEIFDSFTIK